MASSRRPWLTVGVWLALLVAAVVIAGLLLGGALTTEARLAGSPESSQARTILEERLRGEEPVNEVVIVRSEVHTIDDPPFATFVGEIQAEIAALGDDVVTSQLSYYQTPSPLLVSDDRHTTIVLLVMTGDFDQASDVIDQVLDVTRAADTAPDFDVLQNGLASVGKDFEELAREDLETGEVYGVLAALAILLLVFGAVVAALVPVLLAFVAIAVTLGIVAVLGQAWEFSFFVTNMVVGMGLALGIDYSLFILSRFREERALGNAEEAAIRVAGATASRAVVFSGAAFGLALLGMLLVPATVMRSLAIGAVTVGIVSVLVALTLLPAVLTLLGDRVNALGIPWIARRTVRGAATEARFWGRIADAVMKRPLLSLVVFGGLLVAATIPAFSLNAGAAGVSTLPAELPSKEAFLILEEQFAAGQAAPVEIVIDGEAAGSRSAVSSLESTLAADARFGSSSTRASAAGDLTLVSLPLTIDPNTDEATQAVRDLRDDVIPATFAGVEATVLVGGLTASNVDFLDVADRFRPIVFAFVLGLSFLLLMVAFRSIVVPAKAIVLNLLSVGAAYGLLVLVFQKGYAPDFLGFQQIDTVEAWLPLFLFSVLFGLSMDYHVFLLSRIRERFAETGDNTEAVAFGVRSTARLITGAALIMVAVFSGFAAGRLVAFQQMGFSLAVALFLDATVIRSVLVPASMKLLGEWNWYLPSWLEWLPVVEAGPARGPGESPAGDRTSS